MAWRTASTAQQLADERAARAWWAKWDLQHPAPRRTGRPGRWVLPAYVGPGSPQSPVWVEDDPEVILLW